TDGIASPEFRAALRQFQRHQGLPVSGFVGPDTIAALQRTSGAELEWEWENMLARSPKPRPGKARRRGVVEINEHQIRLAQQYAKSIDSILEQAPPYSIKQYLDDDAKQENPFYIGKIGKSAGLYRITFRDPDQPRSKGLYNGQTGVYIGMADKKNTL